MKTGQQLLLFPKHEELSSYRWWWILTPFSFIKALILVSSSLVLASSSFHMLARTPGDMCMLPATHHSPALLFIGLHALYYVHHATITLLAHSQVNTCISCQTPAIIQHENTGRRLAFRNKCFYCNPNYSISMTDSLSQWPYHNKCQKDCTSWVIQVFTVWAVEINWSMIILIIFTWERALADLSALSITVLGKCYLH